MILRLPGARLALAAVLALLSALGLHAPAAQAAPAVEGIGAYAVDASGQRLTSAYFVERRAAGSTFNLNVRVSNSGPRFARLHLDGVDALTSDRGGTVFAARTVARRAAGAWLTPAKTLIRLEPGQSQTISVAVRVPADARPGDHVGGIAIEPARQKTTGGQFSITQITRVVIAAQVKVEGPRTQALNPKVLRLAAVEGSEMPALTVRLANDGDLLCKTRLKATLSSGGRVVSAEQRVLDTILAKTSIDYPLFWPRGLKSGTYEATVRTNGCGRTNEASAQVELGDDLSGTTPPATNGPLPTPSTDSASPVSLAALVPAGLVLLISGWGLSQLSVRRRERRRREAERAERRRDLGL